MRRTEARHERKSFPAIQDTQPKQTATTEQRSSLPAVQDEPKQLTISEADVRLRAYELYVQRGGAPGNELADWLEAERELREASGRADA